jgi:phospholipid transport system substrate-binding protein
MARWCAALAVVLTLLGAGEAVAGAPTDQLRRSVDLVLKILSDPQFKTEGKTAERRRLIRSVANEIFDFMEISQRSLARYWQARTPAERKEFVRLFSNLLEYSYVSKIESYSGEKIRYVGEVPDGGDRAVVRTLIVTKQNTEIPVDYRMFRLGDRWRAYDVTIEGISLVANYRAQFNTIIQRSGYPDLVAKLKEKEAAHPDPRETGPPPEVVEKPAPPSAPPTRQSP